MFSQATQQEGTVAVLELGYNLTILSHVAIHNGMAGGDEDNYSWDNHRTSPQLLDGICSSMAGSDSVKFFLFVLC